MNKYILDRIEEGIAILETENSEFINISASDLPENATAGDTLLFENGEYKILTDETNKRKEKIRNLRNSLREE